MPRLLVRPTRARLLALATLPALLALAACDSDPTAAGDLPVRGVVVLHGFGAQGISSLDTALAARNFVAFDAGFDGGSFTIGRDTALTTSSRAGGDKLYITDLAARTMRTVQLPAASNPAGATFVPSTAGVSRFAVALRDSAAIAVVAVPQAGTPTVTMLYGAGQCPTEVFVVGSDIWSVDANANCRTDYAIVGPVRLIRMAANGARDTLALPAHARGSALSVVLFENLLYVATSGEMDFATGAVTTAPAITRLNLASRQVLGAVLLPAGYWGASLDVGLDDRFYINSYDVPAGYRNRVFAMDPRSGEWVGTRVAGQSYLRLVKPGDAPADCAAVAADAASQVYCAENGAASATTVWVFDRTGAPLRSGAAGQGAVDIALLR